MAAMQTKRSRHAAFPKEFKERASLTILAGVTIILAAVAMTWFLWEAGWVWGVSLVGLGGGAVLTADGFAAHKREARARMEWPRMVEAKDELVQSLLAVKADGHNPQDWLSRQGFEHRGIQKRLIAAMKREETYGG